MDLEEIREVQWVVQLALPARLSLGWPEADRPLLQALGPRQDLVLKVRGCMLSPSDDGEIVKKIYTQY